MTSTRSFVGCVVARTRENRDLRVGASTHSTCFETEPSKRTIGATTRRRFVAMAGTGVGVVLGRALGARGECEQTEKILQPGDKIDLAESPQEIAEQLADKIAHLRIFEDEADKMNLSLLDTGRAAIVVSQFTLYADTSKGRRPSFIGAAPPDTAEPLVTSFAKMLADHGVPTQEGVFGAHMDVALVNDGPVTITMDY